jgi:hypothetical protein
MKINIDSQVEKFIGSLERFTIAKVIRTIDLLEKFGYKLGMPHSKSVQGSLFELRIRGQQEVRIIYCILNNEAYLLYALIKKSQKIPDGALRLAQRKRGSLMSID